MKRLQTMACGGLVALSFVAAPLILAGSHAGAATLKSRFTCRAKVVSARPGARVIVVKLESGSKTIMALRPRNATIRIAPKATLIDASRQASPLSVRTLVRGAIVGLSGTITRSKLVAPRSVATTVTLKSLPAGTLRWSDEFNGTAGAPPDQKNWVLDTGGSGFGNNELEYYTARARNVALDGQGHLAISALRETFSGGGYTRSYTSAKIEGLGKRSLAYGSIRASIKLPAGQGLWPAFWALGTDVDKVGWPQSGEIDIMENLGQAPFTVYASIHGPSMMGASAYGLTTAVQSATSLSQAFHVYGVNWSPNLLQMTLDGVPYATYTPSSLSQGQQWVFNKPFFLILNLAVGGDWPGAPNASTTFPATMLVDWVRLYS